MPTVHRSATAATGQAFILGGRIALTLDVAAPKDGAWNMNVFSRSGAALAAANVSAWHVGAIWVEPFDVLARRRTAAVTDVAAE